MLFCIQTCMTGRDLVLFTSFHICIRALPSSVNCVSQFTRHYFSLFSMCDLQWHLELHLNRKCMYTCCRHRHRKELIEYMSVFQDVYRKNQLSICRNDSKQNCNFIAGCKYCLLYQLFSLSTQKNCNCLITELPELFTPH